MLNLRCFENDVDATSTTPLYVLKSISVSESLSSRFLTRTSTQPTQRLKSGYIGSNIRCLGMVQQKFTQDCTHVPIAQYLAPLHCLSLMLRNFTTINCGAHIKAPHVKTYICQI